MLSNRAHQIMFVPDTFGDDSLFFGKLISKEVDALIERVGDSAGVSPWKIMLSLSLI